MPVVDLLVSTPVIRSARALQLSGLFDVPPSEQSERAWQVEIPDLTEDWQIGLIVGPSGSGKSTLARQVYSGELVAGYDWPADRSVVDGFPAAMPIQEITGLLSAVGFSSPPSWLRPFACLSNGEQFRVTLARALAEPATLAVLDEFTSVVDRTVARIGSAAVSKAVRRMPGKRFVAVTCHEDVADWLQPDWVVAMPEGKLTRRLLQRRPAIELEIRRVHHSGWQLFKQTHYLSGEHHRSAYCFCAFWQERPVAWCSVLHFPHPRRSAWKEHRTVVLPDFQGVGIGNALSEYVASLFRATGKPYRDVTNHPGHVQHRLRSPLWKCTRGAELTKPKRCRSNVGVGAMRTHAVDRLTQSFEYIGPARPEEAQKFGLPVRAQVRQ